MNRKEFFEKVIGIVKDDQNDTAHGYLRKIQRAYWFAKTVHRGQKRDEGERYFEHCRRVACLLIDHDGYIENKAVGIITALLHDCIEDCFIPEGIMIRCFGLMIGFVNVLSKVRPIFDPLTGVVTGTIERSDDEYYAGISEWGAITKYIKCFDRLDNLRSMSVWPKERQEKYIAETEKYILPIAKRTDKTLYRLLLEEIAKIKKKGGE